MLDGYLEHTIRPVSKPCELHIKIETVSGKISITIKDKADNPVFHQDNIETSEFTVTIQSDAVIGINGKRHQGSFTIKAGL